jgi:tyrosyl-tRNA synthetase
VTELEAGVQNQLDTVLRGVVDCVTREDLERRLRRSAETSRPLRVKLGMDPTAPDLHLGHAVVLRKLRQFQDLGHQAVLVIGGATAMLGDPTGKDKMRPQLSREDVRDHARTYLEQAIKVLDGRSLEIVDNSDWFLGFGFQDLVRLASRMTVARMVERDLFARRLRTGTPIGIHEFLYPLLQGWDSVEIRADVELGGSDQLFNLLVGRDLQEQEGQEPQICLTLPLLVGLDGQQKMSKSLGNYIGLTFDPADVYGKIMSIPDEQMRSYFLLLTELPEARIEAELGRHPRECKVELATRLTALLHGDEAAAAAREAFDRVFKERRLPDEIEQVELSHEEAEGGRIWIVSLLLRVGFARSGSEARRLIRGRGVKLDGEVVEDPDHKVEVGSERVLQVGRRRFVRVVLAAP